MQAAADDGWRGAYLRVRRGHFWYASLLIAAVLTPAYAAQGDTAQESGPHPTEGVAASEPVSVLQVRPNFYMLTVGGVDGPNVAVQIGEDGAVMVDTGPPATAQALLTALRSITNAPLRYVINTSAASDSVGNNAAVSAAGLQLGASTVGVGVASTLGFDGAQAALIIAYQEVVKRMISSPPPGVSYPSAAIPQEFFDAPQKNFYMNQGAIDVIWQPAAHSDGDSVVVFRRDDVVVTGAIFDMTRFPVIDLSRGGSINGEIDAINKLMDTQVTPVTPLDWRETQRYGTLVIPARGHLCEQADLVQYRDMLTIIRDRVAYFIKQGKSLQQVLDLHPAAGYAPRFGATAGQWTTDMFVEAVYRSLKAARPTMQREHSHD